MTRNSFDTSDTTAGQFSLVKSRDELTSGRLDEDTAARVIKVLQDSTNLSGDGRVLQKLQALMDQVRCQPPGAKRTAQMNTIVRTLGQPSNLATLLELLRDSLHAPDAKEAEISQRSRRGRMHCIYGWAGQTLLLASHPEPTVGTSSPTDDMDSFLGYPPAEWDLSIHIWQPNVGAKGFTSTKKIEPDTIVEPPHSHPFDFVSFVSMGEMHQSIYAESGVNDLTRELPPADHQKRYDGVVLQRVDGVWPPHQEYRPARLDTLEERVLLQAGHSYFMPCDAIHDVEVNRAVAERQPAITLFMCAEAIVKPHAFMAPEMADYHRRHPELKEEAQALTMEQWQSKLSAVIAYLRRQSQTLKLGEVVQCGTTYSFMHV